ncbi:MAG: MarR family transcriptional regulator [Tissierellia bacterium]|nr:MarR family transcriptional regulator [Tissierellia bacterium]
MAKNLFGIPVQYERWDQQGSLPLYIADGYDFSGIIIGKKRAILIKPRGKLPTLPALKKQIAKIQTLDNVPVILDLDGISPYRRKSFIENNIPFLTPKQIFLPFMGTMLTEENENKTHRFVFSTQQLLLLYLYSNKKQLYLSEAAKILPFTPMTLSRAAKQLEGTDLFTITKDGVKKVMEAKVDRAELFQKSKAFLSNPARQWGYIDKKDVTSDMVIAGETALSEKTMLNPPRLATYAISQKNFNKGKLEKELIDPHQQVQLELWAYDPKLFSRKNTADSLSVALSFEGNHDERIEEAIHQLVMEELADDQWNYRI